MATTQLYIELIVIGLETFIWMWVFLVNIAGQSIMNIFDKVPRNLSSSLFFIGILYIMGIIMEGLAEIIFLKGGDEIRGKSGVKAKNTHLLWEKNHAEKYSDYTKSKIRILRATILNLPLITIAFSWWAFRYMEEPCKVLLYIIVIGVSFTMICCKSYDVTIKRYYDKAHALEESEKDANQSHVHGKKHKNG